MLDKVLHTVLYLRCTKMESKKKKKKKKKCVMDVTRGVDAQSESEECKTSGARQAKRELEKGVTRRTGRASRIETWR